MHLSAKHVFNSAKHNYSVVLYGSNDLSEGQVEMWSELTADSLEPNPFYTPEFVLPLVKSLGIENVDILVVLDEEQNWQFAVPVVSHYFEQGLPLPKFRALRSHYIFLNSPLIRRQNSAYLLTCLFDVLSSQRDWHGAGFSKTIVNSEQTELIEFLATVSSVEVKNSIWYERPCVTPQSQEELLSNCSSSRRKTLRKGWKKLAKNGDVEYRLKQAPEEIPSAVDSFLRLEALGWKGSQGTALECQGSHANFFREMCTRFAVNERVIFGELLLNNQVIASTCNLLAGDRLFAFKIGWDHDYSDCSLGYWSEILLTDAIHKDIENVKLIDSCSDADSYTGKVWQERLQVGSTVLIWSRRAKIMRGAKSAVKRLVKNEPN